MRVFAMLFALAALAACSRNEERKSAPAPAKPAPLPAKPAAATAPVQAKRDGGARAADAGEPEVAAASPAPPSDTDTALLHDEGSARPPVVVRAEPPVPRPSFPAPKAGAMVSIPGGTLNVGSRADDRLRVDFAESDLVPVQMTPFEMDALPFPNDPAQPFLTGVTRAAAAEACRQAGKRLCTELEWEWACKSADNRRYPTGNAYDPADYQESRPLAPASPFGVFAMGHILEWTSSAWGDEPDQVERGAARGFAQGEELPAAHGRRCANRWRRMPDAGSPSLGLRCCRGEPNKAVCAMERTRPPFSLYNNMKPDKFARVIRSIPELAAIHDNPRMFSDADVRTVLARRETDREDLARSGIHFRWKPIRWIPRQGIELWVAVGRSDKHAFIVALYEVEDNERYVHASSLVLWNQPAPLALAYREGHRDELYWAPCWGCRDGGSVAFDDASNEVIITHKW